MQCRRLRKKLAKRVALAITEEQEVNITARHVESVILEGKAREQDEILEGKAREKDETRCCWREVHKEVKTNAHDFGCRTLPFEEKKKTSTTSLWYSLPYGALVQAFKKKTKQTQIVRSFRPNTELADEEISEMKRSRLKMKDQIDRLEKVNAE